MTPDEPNWSEWEKALASDRTHHAWLLAGPAGLGKADFALNAARTLVGQPQLAPHPDIIELRRPPKDDREARKRDEGKPFETRRNIGVAQIREMQVKLTTRPSMGERRAVVVDPADDMERSASNALLKSLEEPPRGTFFFLVAHHSAQILPTIRSRCRLLRFRPVAAEKMRALLDNEFPEADPETIDVLARHGKGSIGQAKRLFELGLDKAVPLLNGLYAAGDSTLEARGTFASTLGARPDRATLSATLDLAANIVGDYALSAEPDKLERHMEVHRELVRLRRELPTYNYDPQVIALEIGTLLGSLR